MSSDTADTMAWKAALQKVIAIEFRAPGLQATEIPYDRALQGRVGANFLDAWFSHATEDQRHCLNLNYEPTMQNGMNQDMRTEDDHKWKFTICKDTSNDWHKCDETATAWLNTSRSAQLHSCGVLGNHTLGFGEQPKPFVIQHARTKYDDACKYICLCQCRVTLIGVTDAIVALAPSLAMLHAPLWSGHLESQRSRAHPHRRAHGSRMTDVCLCLAQVRIWTNCVLSEALFFASNLSTVSMVCWECFGKGLATFLASLCS